MALARQATPGRITRANVERMRNAVTVGETAQKIEAGEKRPSGSTAKGRRAMRNARQRDFRLHQGARQMRRKTGAGASRRIRWMSETLLQPVRVPRQVVVDHQVGTALKVDALAGGVIGDHDLHQRIVVERRDRGAAGLPRYAAMDDDGGLGTDLGADLLRQVFERVARLGEDDDLVPEQRLGRQVTGVAIPGRRHQMDLWSKPRPWAFKSSELNQIARTFDGRSAGVSTQRRPAPIPCFPPCADMVPT